MAKALPIKTKRRVNAAYAASQPLFDVLGKGMQRLDAQRADLEIARSAVQKLHVKLPSSSIADDVLEDHETYMDAAVKAWRTATESYRDVFDALAKVTAADPSSGQSQRDGHEAFVKMAGSARDAYDTAMDWRLTTPRASLGASTPSAQEPKQDTDMSDVDESEESDETGVDEAQGAFTTGTQAGSPANPKLGAADGRPTNPILQSLLDKGVKVEIPEPPPGQRENGAETNAAPTAAAQTKSDDAGRSRKRLEKRRKRKEKREQARENDASAGQGRVNGGARKTAHVALDSGTESKQIQLEYEDVSAEVTARLKAKDAKPETAKEKKRKRESATSLENGQVETKAEKPTKKKTKSDAGEAVNDTAKKEKARKHEREAEGAENGLVEEGRKKRKKA